MKKLHLLFFFVLASASIGSAQNALKMGQTQLNAGLGLSNWGVPVYVGFDHAVHSNVTLGTELSLRSFNDQYKDDRYNHTIFGLSGNANYHFNSILDIPENWDLYAGLSVGFYHWNSPKDYFGNYRSSLGLVAQVGGRYYFTNRLGINLEFGGGNVFSAGKIGLTLKL